MYSINRLLIALDLTALDQTLISYASAFAKSINVETVYFFHVAKSLELPSKLAEKYPDLLAPKDQQIKENIQANIDKHWSYDCKYKIEIREGNAVEQIFRWTDIQHVDMIVVGRKLQLKGRGVIPGKIARLAHCSVLFVPENAVPQFKKVLVPVDFSKNSHLAMGMALEFQKSSAVQIVVQNSYHVPWGYSSTGKSYEEFAQIMREHAKEDAKAFIKKNKLTEDDVEIALSLDKDEDPAERAYEEATQRKVDMVIMSSKGRSGLAKFLMGSVADKMIQIDANIPLLVAKNKHDNMGFFDALLKI